MMDEDSDGVRIKIFPCAKEQFRRRMEATKMLEADFYLPNRAQLMLGFLQKHGDRVDKDTACCKNTQHARGSECLIYLSGSSKRTCIMHYPLT